MRIVCTHKQMCLFQSMFSVYVFVRMCVRACALVQLEARYYSLVSSKKKNKSKSNDGMIGSH